MNLDDTLRQASVALSVQLNLAEDIVAGIEQAVTECADDYAALCVTLTEQLNGSGAKPAVAIAATASVLCGIFEVVANKMLKDPQFDGLMKQTAYLAFTTYLDRHILEWQEFVFSQEAA